MKKLEERREKKQAEVDRCAELRGMLYEDMKDGIISRKITRNFMQHMSNERKMLKFLFIRLN